MRFDGNAPGNGVDATCRMDNGKVILQWEIYLLKEEYDKNIKTGKEGLEVAGPGKWIKLCLFDKVGNVAAECMQWVGEEEPLQSVILQPHYWRGINEPYLYRLTAMILDSGGKCLDRMERALALCCLQVRVEAEKRVLYLNEERVKLQVVEYVFDGSVPSAERYGRFYKDLQRLVGMGANCLYTGQEEPEGLLLQLCWKMGILVCRKSEKGVVLCGQGKEIELSLEDNIPFYKGGKESLFSESDSPTSLYHRYRAMWSPVPFVYIVPESVQRLESGNYQVTCYSSCGKVALYSDGTFFECKRGEGEFIFWEIPVKGPCIILTAEGEGCNASLSFHKTFACLL